MTLIQAINVGGVACIMTSDTRRVMKLGKTILPYFDSTSKTEQISPYLLVGGGGADYITDEIKAALIEAKPTYLDDVTDVFIQSTIDVRQNYKKEIKKGDCAQFIVAGFNKDGTSGYFNFDTSLNHKVDTDFNFLENLESAETRFIPNAKVHDKAMEKIKRPDIKELSELVPKILSYLAKIQYYQFKKKPKEISEVFHYNAIYFNEETEEYEHYNGTVNLEKTKGEIEIG